MSEGGIEIVDTFSIPKSLSAAMNSSFTKNVSLKTLELNIDVYDIPFTRSVATQLIWPLASELHKPYIRYYQGANVLIKTLPKK